MLLLCVRCWFRGCCKHSYRLLPITVSTDGIITANGRHLLSPRHGSGSTRPVEHYRIHWKHPWQRLLWAIIHERHRAVSICLLNGLELNQMIILLFLYSQIPMVSYGWLALSAFCGQQLLFHGCRYVFITSKIPFIPWSKFYSNVICWLGQYFVSKKNIVKSSNMVLLLPQAFGWCCRGHYWYLRPWQFHIDTDRILEGQCSRGYWHILWLSPLALVFHYRIAHHSRHLDDSIFVRCGADLTLTKCISREICPICCHFIHTGDLQSVASQGVPIHSATIAAVLVHHRRCYIQMEPNGTQVWNS